jgi:hypothetical protein
MSQDNRVDGINPYKRPFLLTILCAAYFFMFVWQLVRLLIPAEYTRALVHFPNWYVLGQLIILYPVGILSVVAVWIMRRWGLYLYCVLTLSAWIVMITELHLLPHLNAVVLSTLFCIVGFVFIKRMR